MVRRDAETRRNAVRAIGDLIITVGIGRRVPVEVEWGTHGLQQRDTQQQQRQEQQQQDAVSSSLPPPQRDDVGGQRLQLPSPSFSLSPSAAESPPGLSQAQFEALFTALCDATHDYATDNRGDVGSWVRRAAMDALLRVVVFVQGQVWRAREVVALLSTCSNFNLESRENSETGTHFNLEPVGSGSVGFNLEHGRVLAAPPGLSPDRFVPLASPSLALFSAFQSASGTLHPVPFSVGTSHSSSAASAAGSGGGGGGVTVLEEAAIAAAALSTLLPQNRPRVCAGNGSGSTPTSTCASAVSANGMWIGDVVISDYGVGRIVDLTASGWVAEVAFPALSMGAACFPYGSGLISVSKLRLCRRGTRLPSPGTSAAAVPVARGGASSSSSSLSAPTLATAALSPAPATAATGAAQLPCSEIEVQPLRSVRLYTPLDDPSLYLSPPLVSAALCCFLRQSAEKLDSLRSVAGEGLCALLHLPAPLPPLAHVRRRRDLEELFPSPLSVVNFNLGAAAAAAVSSNYNSGAHSAAGSGGSGGSSVTANAHAQPEQPSPSPKLQPDKHDGGFGGDFGTEDDGDAEDAEGVPSSTLVQLPDDAAEGAPTSTSGSHPATALDSLTAAAADASDHTSAAQSSSSTAASAAAAVEALLVPPSAPASSSMDAHSSSSLSTGGEVTTTQSSSSGPLLINWSAPHQSYPRLCELFSTPTTRDHRQLQLGRLGAVVEDYFAAPTTSTSDGAATTSTAAPTTTSSASATAASDDDDNDDDDDPYTLALIEGLVTSVGGLSESVVKHSTAALTAWAREANRRGDARALRAVAGALLRLLRARPRQSWECFSDAAAAGSAWPQLQQQAAPSPSSSPVSGEMVQLQPGAAAPQLQLPTRARDLGGYSSAFDPNMSRWFANILGTGSSSASGGGRGMLEDPKVCSCSQFRH